MHKLFFLALALLLFSGKSVLACMCGNTPSVWEARDDAQVVFLGKAISSEYQKGSVSQNGTVLGEELAVRFKVERWWKGKASDEVVIFADQYRAPDQSISISTCGMEYKIGKDYLIYAVEYSFDGKFDGKLRAAYCSRSAEREDAKKDLKKLGKGYKQVELKKNQ